ncbi:MAG: methyltransferase domain-containing protein, partial [Elusimicrobia bacterium]|nr:methyltransferase domain-containing protein [Elusimicrobiota bacterium]
TASGRLAADCEVAGLDLDGRLSQSCRERGVRLFVADLEAGAIPPLGRRFELFTALDVLEHLPAPEKLLSSLRLQLADDALGVVAVPAFQSLFSDWDRAAGHVRRYDGASLKTLLESARFEVLWQSYLYSFALPPAFLRRKALKTAAAETKLEFPKLPPWLNGLLRGAGALERLWLKAAPLPFGTSALAVVRQRAGGAGPRRS